MQANREAATISRNKYPCRLHRPIRKESCTRISTPALSSTCQRADIRIVDIPRVGGGKAKLRPRWRLLALRVLLLKRQLVVADLGLVVRVWVIVVVKAWPLRP